MLISVLVHVLLQECQHHAHLLLHLLVLERHLLLQLGLPLLFNFILLASSSICCRLRSISSSLLVDRYSRGSDAFRLFLLRRGSDDSVDSSSSLDLPSPQVFIDISLNLSPFFLSESAFLIGAGTWASISSFISSIRVSTSVGGGHLSQRLSPL